MEITKKWYYTNSRKSCITKGAEDLVSDVMYKLDYVELGTTTYTEKQELL